jgi:hypothetical protein
LASDTKGAGGDSIPVIDDDIFSHDAVRQAHAVDDRAAI